MANRDDLPAPLQALAALAGVKEVVEYVIWVGIVVALLVMGNALARGIGVVLLAAALAVGIGFVRQRRRASGS